MNKTFTGKFSEKWKLANLSNIVNNSKEKIKKNNNMNHHLSKSKNKSHIQSPKQLNKLLIEYLTNRLLWFFSSYIRPVPSCASILTNS